MGFRFMKIKILESAKEDLKEGYYFYEIQRKGLGSYFLEALYADIESLKLFVNMFLVAPTKYNK